MTALSPDFFRRFDVPGPRYTSYPTADRLVDAFGSVEYAQALDERRSATAGLARALSIYVHIPFCESLCYYCACNKIITRHPERAQTYLRYLEREMAQVAQHLGRGQQVSQMHFGGGTPTFLSDEQLEEMFSTLKRYFTFTPGGEYSIEIDPRTVTNERLDKLAKLGFNRLSFGVQDFDPMVQKAVHRVQSTQQVFDLTQHARDVGYESVNIDLIYGLPMQSQASFVHTLDKVCELRPDRIALYAYAHLPERFKPQRRINAAELPDGASKIVMLDMAIRRLTAAGYDYIGMDHFALPQDSLAVAKRQGRLHRNFQGYSTQPDCDLVGLGVSAISKVGATYSQNAKTLDEYYDLLEHGSLPVVRGLALSRDDLLRRAVIMALMCQGGLVFESVNLAWLIDFKTYFRNELENLKSYEADGLVKLDDSGIEVTPLGWFVVRAIAMTFDRYIQADRTRAKFSRII
ncbi:MAG: oxygen-independent coproporphyrinogen oxidase [Pseudomonadota bacterium]|jgi:oxygen-independent coproporphyrinogen-3 oxidase